LNGGIHWQIYAGIAALLVLTLALLWPDSSNRGQQRETSPDIVSQLPLHASESAPIPAVEELRNPFANSGIDTSLTEPVVKTNALHPELPALTQDDKTDDWGQWRKADERLRSYLGGPPDPGKPAE